MKYLLALLLISGVARAGELPKFNHEDGLEVENIELKVEAMQTKIAELIKRRDGLFKKYGFHVTEKGEVVKDK